jgi:tRNA(fMet)-specific endonuclease VapC
MRIALDTNRYADFCRGSEAVVQTVRRAEAVFLPFITVAELRTGFLCGSRARQNEGGLNRFLGSRRVGILFPDEQTTHHYARLFYQLRRQGTPIPTNDIWIAALVVQHDLLLCARDHHFDHLPQVPRI